MLVVNLLGEPGVGKSVTAAGLYYLLSINGHRSEVIPEVAKGYAWDTPKDHTGKSYKNPVFDQQVFLLGKQNRLLERVKGKVDIAIMECPLILMDLYKPENYLKDFTNLVLEQFHRYNNFNIVIERNHNYNPNGRLQNEEEAKEVKNKLISFLQQHNIEYITLKTDKEINQKIFNMIIDKIK
jgi:hypothetical protein